MRIIVAKPQQTHLEKAVLLVRHHENSLGQSVDNEGRYVVARRVSQEMQIACSSRQSLWVVGSKKRTEREEVVARSRDLRAQEAQQ